MTLSYAFPSDAQGWTFATTNDYSGHGGFDAHAWDGTVGNPAGSLRAFNDPRNTAGAVGYWELSGTWASLGIPSGATVTAIQMSLDEKVVENDSGATIGAHALYSGGGTLDATLLLGRNLPAGVTDPSWQSRSGSTQPVGSGNRPASSSISIRLAVSFGDGADSGGDVHFDNVAIVLTYTPAVPATPRVIVAYQSDAQLMRWLD